LTGPNGSHEFYDDFQALMLDIGKLYNAASTERLKQLMLVLVPAFTFMAAIIICGYLVLFR